MLLLNRLISVVATMSLAGCAGGTATSSSAPATPLGPVSAVSFQCPVAGTKTRVANGSVVNTTTWNGADPADSVVCLATTNSGRSLRVLYGFINLPMRAGEQEARKTFAAVFSGSSEHSCYGVIEQASNVGGVNATYAYNWCWQQAGQTTRVLGGTPTRLIVFKASDNGQADNYFSADWTYYFDPAVGIWAEGDAVSNRGIPPNNFIRTVVAPNT